jgi:hypothetical protein
MSRSTGATRSAGNSSVVIKNVANEPAFRSFSLSLRENNEPIWRYSCAKMIASIFWSCPVRKRVQKERMEVGDVTSHSSANICSFEVVVRRRLMRMVTLAESIGSGERAIMWAPRWASDWRIVRPSGVNPP